MSGKIITRILIGLTVIGWIGWDVFAMLHYGPLATESATLYRWSYYAPGVSFACGVLVGHLFFSQVHIFQEIAEEHQP